MQVHGLCCTHFLDVIALVQEIGKLNFHMKGLNLHHI